jgi:two-component system, sensor histidine kinase PdtaS
MRNLSTIILGFFCLVSNAIAAQDYGVEEQRSIDSLEQLTEASNPDGIRANALIQLSLILYITDFDTLLPLNAQARDIAFSALKANPGKDGEFAFLEIAAEATNNIGYYYQESGDYAKAMECYTYCLESDRKTNNWAGISATLNNIGMIYNYQGNVFKSLDFFLLSLQIDEALEETDELGYSLNNIAYLYEHQQDTAKALHYYKRALTEFQKTGDLFAEGSVLINLGSIFRKQQLTERADSCFRKSMAINRSLGNMDREAAALLNLGFLYFEDSLMDSSRHFLNRALALKTQVGDPNGECIILVNIGKCDLVENNLDEALQNGEKAMEMAQKTGHVYNLKSAADLLASVYEKKGRFEESLVMHKLFISLRDSLENNKTQQYTFQKGLHYEYEKKQAVEMAEHQKQIELRDLQQQNQRVVMILVVFLFFLILIFVLILFSRYKKMRLQKKIIETKNAENELLLGEIHHRVKNNLQVIASLLSLQEKSIDDITAKKAILEGKERVNSMSLIHKLLYQQDRFSGVEMNEYIQKLLEGLMKTFGQDSGKLKLDIQFPAIHLDVDSAVPIGLIINELVINAFKYAFEMTASPELKIKLENKGELLLLEVKDNGKGNAETVLQSNSFGFKLVSSLVRQINGEMHVESNNGLRYFIHIRDFKLVS